MLLVPAVSGADRLAKLLFDMQFQATYARELSRSVVALEIEPKRAAELDDTLKQVLPAFAVAVRVPAGLRLLTGGPIAAEAAVIWVISPSGRRVRVTGTQQLGGGEIAALEVPDFLLWSELAPLSLDETIELKVSTPLFAVDALRSARPFLVKATVMEVLELEALKGLFVTDLRFPHGTPLLSADNTVLGVAFRAHPDKPGLVVGVTWKRLRAWLHPESPADDKTTPAPR